MLARHVGRHVGRMHARATSKVDPPFPGYYVHRSDWFFFILVEMLRHLEPGAGCFRVVSQIRQLRPIGLWNRTVRCQAINPSTRSSRSEPWDRLRLLHAHCAGSAVRSLHGAPFQELRKTRGFIGSSSYSLTATILDVSQMAFISYELLPLYRDECGLLSYPACFYSVTPYKPESLDFPAAEFEGRALRLLKERVEERQNTQTNGTILAVGVMANFGGEHLSFMHFSCHADQLKESRGNNEAARIRWDALKRVIQRRSGLRPL